MFLSFVLIFGTLVKVPLKILFAFFASFSIVFAYFVLNLLILGNFVIESAPAFSNWCISFRCVSHEPATIFNFGNSLLVFLIHCL